VTFEWDDKKDTLNKIKHGVSFTEAQFAFMDPSRLILADEKHSQREARWFCIGRVPKGILTVRFTLRIERIRIIGAGYWREGKEQYEVRNTL
jgi:uncharacterized DUF497 family protein